MKRILILLLLLPFFANSQVWVNGQIQKLSTSDSLRYFQGSNAIPLAKYSDLPVVPAGLTDSLLKKANRDMSNVANSSIPISKVNTSSVNLQFVTNNGYLTTNPINIGGNDVGTGGVPAVLLNRTMTLSGSSSRGIRDNSKISFTSGEAYASFDAQGATQGTANVHHIVGFQSRPIHQSSGTIQELAAFSAIPLNLGGTAAEMWGFKVFPNGGSTGGVTRFDGLRVTDQPVGTERYGVTSELTAASNKYNIYSSGTAKNYFAGNVMIGANSDNGNKLQVYGNASVSSNFTFGLMRVTNPTSFSASGSFGYNGTYGSAYWTRAGTVNDWTIFNDAGTVSIGIPTGTNNIKVSDTLITTGFKMPTGASSGRVLTSDASGKGTWQAIGSSYKGTWDASTNTPTLADGVGTIGDYYWVSTGGTQFGRTFVTGGQAVYNGSIWQAVGSTTGVSSFAGRTGAVTPQSSDYSSYYVDFSSAQTISGAKNFSNSIRSSASGAGILVYDDTTSVSPKNIFLRNDEGSFIVGIEGSTPGQTFAGSTAYATVIGNAGSKPIEFFVNNSKRLSVNPDNTNVFTGSISASNLSGTNTGDQTDITGNAGTATKLQTARNINGVPFDGSSNIAIGTTVGQNLLNISNPSAIRFLRVNADNTVSALSASDFRTAIGAGTGSVTSVSAGNGMNFTTISGSGSVSMGTPSSITSTSTNTVSGTTHTHAITSLPSTVTATTQTASNSSTLVATTAFVHNVANAKVQNSLTASTTVAPSATAVNTALALKANLSGATFTGAISATNLSGTNTGDNATNTTSNSYADAKVQNSLTASTTVAPSATAVNNALASKVGSISAGNGMNFTTITNSGSVTLGTPSSITSTSTNLVSETSHSHAITSLPSSVTATTQAANTNNTTLATTAYADAKVQNSLTASTTIAPSATAVNNALALKANLSGATFTGAINGTTATFSGDVTANSDRRLKRDIRRLKNVSGSLRALGAYIYKMKGSNADKIGLIAQQVEKYYPQLVITDSKGIKSVNYQAFTAVLLQGWKELDERVTKLENK